MAVGQDDQVGGWRGRDRGPVAVPGRPGGGGVAALAGPGRGTAGPVDSTSPTPAADSSPAIHKLARLAPCTRTRAAWRRARVRAPPSASRWASDVVASSGASRARVPAGSAPSTAGREVIECPRRGQQGEHPVRGTGVHAEIAGRGEHLMPVPAAIEQAQQAGGTPHAGQRDGPARVDPDLHGVPVTPYGRESRFQRWSHKENARAAV